MQRNCSVALVIPICIIVTLYFHFSLLIGDNNPVAHYQHHVASFQAPRDIKKNATLTEPVPSEARKREKKQRTLTDERSYSGVPFEKLSSVDSFTCCGIGHRMTRLVNAAHVALQINFALRVFWDFCGDEVEVFHHFFGPQPREEMMSVNTTGNVLRLHNEIPGYRKLVREGPNAPCKCTADKVAFDTKFYAGLRNRFRNKEHVDEFVASNFANHTVVGLHVRTGNGEQGDFVDKNRLINDMNAWVRRISDNIRNMTLGWRKPPLLYIATETPSMVEKFRDALAGAMNVVYLPQQRSEEGHGVFFGERGVVHGAIRDETKCLDGWNAAISDMLILSHTDVVVAARPSSFTQTLPMTLVLGKPKETRSVKHGFCEFNLAGTEMRCFPDYLNWCCNGVGSFVFAGINQRYDYPKVGYELEKQEWVYSRRPPDCNLTAADGLVQRDCIPFSWPSN